MKMLPLLCILLYTSNYIIAQSKIVSYQHIGAEQGLVERQINCGMQDSRGFVWLGTTHGLQRYDGKSFLKLSKDKNGLQDNVVSKIVEDDYQNLWLLYGLFNGTAQPIPGKIDILDLKTNKVLSIQEKFGSQLPFNHKDAGYIYSNEKKELFICVLAQKNEQRILYNTYLYTSKLSFQRHIDMEFVYEPTITFKGNTIAYRKGNYNYVYNTTTKVEQVVTVDQPNLQFIQYNNTQDSIYYKFNNLGTLSYCNISTSGITRYQNALPIYNNTKATLSGAQIYDVHNDELTRNAILYVNQDEIYLLQNALCIKILDAKAWNNEFKLVIFNYFTTKDNQSWLCTSNGLYVVKVINNKFQHILSSDVVTLKILSQYQIRNIVETNTGHYYINSWGGIFELNEQDIPNTKPKPLFKLYGFYNTEGMFFDGTYISQFALYTIQQYNVYTKNSTNIKTPLNEQVWTGILTKNNACIVATYNYVALQRNVTLTPLTFANNTTVPNNWVHHFYYTKDGLLWAMGNNGIFSINSVNKVTAHYTSNTSNTAYKLPTNEVNAMYEDDKGILWLATNELGLVKWDRATMKFEKITTDNGLSSNTLYGVLQDVKENLWLSSDNGIMRYNPNTGLIKIYKTTDGITNNEFNRCSFLQTKSGSIWFGGLNGITAFNPSDFWTDTATYAPNMCVTAFNQFNNNTGLINKTEQLSHSNTITVQSADQFFTLEFQLLDYNAGEKRYAYILQGLDKDWTFTTDNTIRLSSLPYGTYTLQVKGRGSDGNWSTHVLNYTVVVIKPFYKTIAFILLVIILFIGLIYAYFKYKLYQLKKNNKKLELTVSNRTAQLNSSLQQKEILLKEVHHRVKNNLSVIGGLLSLQSNNTDNEQAKLAMQESQNRINAIAIVHHRLYQHDAMDYIEIKSFIKDLYGQVATIFSNKTSIIAFNLNVPNLLLDIDTAVPLGLIINELITNSYKYAFAVMAHGSITIHITTTTTGHYVLTYTDDGEGLPPLFNIATSNTLGIKIIRLLTTQLSGTVAYVYSNKLSTFTITFKDSKTRNDA